MDEDLHTLAWCGGLRGCAVWQEPLVRRKPLSIALHLTAMLLELLVERTNRRLMFDVLRSY